MARATRNSKAAPALSSPPARRTRSKLKEKASTPNDTNNNAVPSSSSQQANDLAPAHDAEPETNSAPAADPMPATDASSAAPKSKNRGKKRQVVNHNTVNKNKVTKPRARKPPVKKTTAAAKSAVNEQVQEDAVATPRPELPLRRTRATTRAGIKSPLAPVVENANGVGRRTRSKKLAKNATPLSIITNEKDTEDLDNWFGECANQPDLYRNSGVTMEDVSEHEDAHMTENDEEMAEHDEEMAEHDSASSGAEGADVENAMDEDHGSETEEDVPEQTAQLPRTPEPTNQNRAVEMPTTGRTFGIASLLRTVIPSTVKRLFNRSQPALPSPSSSLTASTSTPPVASAASPVMLTASPIVAASPAVPASPSSAAAERRLRSSNKAPVKPRERNADKRHEISEMQKDISQLKREELEALFREQTEMLKELSRKKKEEESTQMTGQKRRLPSPDVIPSSRPGEKGYGMLDEYFWDNVDDDDESLPEPPKRSYQRTAKRRKITTPINDDDTDDEYDFANLPPPSSSPPITLRRPRNGYRMAVMKDGGEDPMEINHEHRVMHQSNSFSRSPLRKSGRNTSPSNTKTSPSTIYKGSVMAMPGDSGYKPENVFKMSEEQIQQQSSPKKHYGMDDATLKARAEDIIKRNKAGEFVSAEEDKLFAYAEKKFGNITGSGSFSCPEYSDTESDMSDEDNSDEQPTTPERETHEVESAGFISAKASPKQTVTKDSSMKPPPTPVPAHAQLPPSVQNATNESPANAALNAAVLPKTPAHDQNAAASSSLQTAALARQRELAEKHKPKLGSRLQYVSGISSSPVQPSTPENSEQNPMARSLITQGMTTLPGNGAVSDFEASMYSQMDSQVLTRLNESSSKHFYEGLNEDEKRYLAHLEEQKTKEEIEREDSILFAELDRKVFASAGRRLY